MTATSSRAPQGQELDTRRLWSGWRRGAPFILTATALASGATYLWVGRKPSVYQAVASVIATDNDGRNALINNTLVTAPPLPAGAVEKAVHSRAIVAATVARLAATDMPAALQRRVRRDLENELADNRFRRVTVKARLDAQQRGVYEIGVVAETPRAAEQLARAQMDALVAWDVDRARQGVRGARQSVEEQLGELTARMRTLPENSLDRQSLLSARGELLQQLAQVAVFEKAARGTLSVVAEPVAPRSAVAPRPGRAAALVALFTLLVTSGAALLFDGLRRTVASADDIAALGLPLLGQLPLLSRRELARGFLHASLGGRLLENLGFLRLNLSSVLPDGAHRVLVVSSVLPSEGKSSVSAALARNLAAVGQRVLLIDADLRRPAQTQHWNTSGGTRLLPGAEEHAPSASTLASALGRPLGARAFAVAPNLDLLPADPPARGAAALPLLHQPQLAALIARWSAAYDVVVIDTPPLLSLPDALAVAPLSDGILLVVEAGRARQHDVERAVHNIRAANAPLLGVVLNKASGTDTAYYGYDLYSPPARRGDAAPAPR